ncbi:acetylglucosaminylphosphatidylinositol deacetylase [Streptomyces kronopolitis]|uniref:Acetylglucosaminylphosphatidylinositol deacetylase n=1 Tax=Streptomyces kronopolitis TaxID=1612435 RepID=A0ABQ2J9X5_9ACTN|nr:PIG-L family deacetylase [Streptomyces kronopolitis]GGN43257.1 acetylglucosaminylphosphatidylinositol deacetylase [Streptomyces kronopolitis]
MTTQGREPADPIQARGTDESEWRSWAGWDALPECALPTEGRAVVVAAHPDDEVLGFGGSISLLAAAGVELTVVSVTDGERSHPDSRAVTPESLARVRAEETRAALSELGAPGAEVIRLHVPDTDVAAHEDQVAAALTETLAGAVLCAAPWTGDIHADHEAAGRAARTAAGAVGVPCLLYPVWMWHWAHPDDSRVPWADAARITLPPTTLARKAAAINCFTSQISPLGPEPGDSAILPPEEIAHHLRTSEVVFR